MPSKTRGTPDPRRQARRVVEALKRLYPDARCALVHEGPFQLLVATVLSAQCTDARVNMVTPRLFERFPDAVRLSEADQEELETIIHSTGFFRAKAKNLRAMAGILVDRYGGVVPDDLDALTNLPGVGRKTANVVLGNAFGHATGVVVDTHVKRLAYRLGLTDSRHPEPIERDLIRLVPRKHWIDLSHWLIEHGRKVCSARAPRCDACSLASFCPRRGVTTPRPD